MAAGSRKQTSDRITDLFGSFGFRNKSVKGIKPTTLQCAAQSAGRIYHSRCLCQQEDKLNLCFREKNKPAVYKQEVDHFPCSVVFC